MSDNRPVKESKTEIQIKWKDLVIKLTTTNIIVAIVLGSLCLLAFGIYEFGPRVRDAVNSDAKSSAPVTAPTPAPSGTTSTARALLSAPTSSPAASATSAALAVSALGAASDSDDAIKQNNDGIYNQNHVDIKKSKLLPGTHTSSVTQEMKGSHNVNSVVIE